MYPRTGLFYSLLWSLIGACGGLVAGWTARLACSAFGSTVIETFAAPLIAGALIGLIVTLSGIVAGNMVATRLFFPAVLCLVPGIVNETAPGAILFACIAGTAWGLIRQFFADGTRRYVVGE